MKDMSDIIQSIKNTIESIAGLSGGSIFEEEGSDKPAQFYRGHYNGDFRMLPSIFRPGVSVDEHEVFTEVLRTHLHSDFENMSDFEILSKMQHYQVPTRMLDLTTSPLVASFFALSNLDNKNLELKNPEIICMNFADDEIKDFYSPQVTALSALPRLTKGERINLYFDVLNEMTLSQEIIEIFNENSGDNFNLLQTYQNNKTAIQYIQFSVLTFCKIINDKFNVNEKGYNIRKEDKELFKRLFEENFNIRCETSDKSNVNNQNLNNEITLLPNTNYLNKNLNINIKFNITADYMLFYNYNGGSNSNHLILNIKNKESLKYKEKATINLSLQFIKGQMDDGNYASYYLLLNDKLYDTWKNHKYNKDNMFDMFVLNNGRYFSESAEKLHFYITKYDSTFKHNLKPIDLLNGVIVKPVINNERVNAQHGVFALYGLFKYWNFGKSIKYLIENELSHTKIIVNNFGFIDNNPDFKDLKLKLKELENYVFDITKIKFKYSFYKNKDKVDNYLDRLSKIAGIDVKSLGCRMDSTYYQLTK